MPSQIKQLDGSGLWRGANHCSGSWLAHAAFAEKKPASGSGKTT
jgi:hypothetical protein